ncbi:TetR/AcrR family transcriptional regulator [Bacteriovorax sp. DB6_IX]|uniref:TetR/AcrR family transcriptional regulator n=1 Tax=Bacteriovorax sp. DB6_IX TaxID=1353530 RepID=UPI000389F9B5|nr:TetR/AcrR family transcriptional regulator [Bacteriovorax sp. DB6_IX]EQC51560.1 transcriptional regulator, TetR family [Bacteriovorax sp. DB6_IX]
MKESSQDLVFQKVLDLIEAQSLYDLSISLLKKETGLATGTLYYHFPNGIEDVLSGLFIKISSDLRDSLLQKAMGENDFKESLYAVIAEYFRWHSHEIQKSHFLWCVSGTGFKNFREIMMEEFAIFSKQMYEHLSSKAQASRLKLVEPMILDALLLGATRELIHAWISRGRDSLELEVIEKKYIHILYNSCIESDQ